MKTPFFTLLSIIFSLSPLCVQGKMPPAIPRDPAIEERVDEILKKMSLDDKIGQMTQFTLHVLGANEGETFVFNDEKTKNALRTLKSGSILNVPEIPQTPEAWHVITRRVQKESLEENAIPNMYGLDQIHGSTYTVGGVLYPQPINMGASFNPDLVYKSAEATAYETRACNIPWNFSPVLDLGRDPRWSRMWETYGEDSHLVTVMGEACVKGYQGNNPNKVEKNYLAACLKHFMGYGVNVSGKDRTPSSISIQDMKERHFAPFKKAIRSGALSVMVNSGLNNGVPYHINKEYLTEWLKEGLNWDGVIVTDWNDINFVHTRDRIAETKKEAIKLAINAGIDMSMTPYDLEFPKLLKELVDEGEVPLSRIDDAVERILRMKLRLNLFDQPNTELKDYPKLGGEEFKKLSREAADESITLLKNADNILPLPVGKKILITGPNADSQKTQNGGWTLGWTGLQNKEHLKDYNTFRTALEQRFGKDKVTYQPGASYGSNSKDQIAQAVAAAKDVDYIIVCLGENSYAEGTGNLVTLDLDDNQLDLAQQLTATGKPVILVLNEGRPRVISKIEPGMKAVIQTYLPGPMGGDSLAAILSGDVNPSGKLPYTYPKHANSLLTYDYKPSEHTDKLEGAYNYQSIAVVQWPFGYGLSYTTYEYSKLTVDKKEFTPDDVLTFTVDVKNTGKKEGKEAVMLFTSDLYASLSPDNRRLRAFNKINLKPGETETVTLQIPAKDLAFVGANGQWIIEKGDFKAQIGDQVTMIKCTKTEELKDK